MDLKTSSLIVSLHDVAPSTFSRVRQQLKELTDMGLETSSLLVVPFYHEQKKLSEDESLVNWLKELQSMGHEMVLHGWVHQNSHLGVRRKNLKTYFFENFYTSREAEFLDLKHQEAFPRMEEGLKMFQELGLKAHGFIAPAWLMNSEVVDAARQHQLIYSNTIAELIYLPTLRRIPSRSCVWSTRSSLRRFCSLGWNRLLFSRLHGVEPLRISLHPSDLEYSRVWGQIKKFIQAALRERKATTYFKWIQENVT